MQKKSIIKNISKHSLSLLCLLSLFVILILTYSFYKNYKTNLTFLEKKAFRDYKNVIYKINDNLISGYLIEYKISLQEKKDDIRDRIYLAYSLLQNIYFSKKDEKSIEYLKKNSLRFLQLMKFDNSKNFYSVFNSSGKVIYDPYLTSDLISNVLKKIIINIKNGISDFYIVPWVVSEFSDETESKIIFGIYFPKYDWVIITGFYLKDFNYEFDRNKFLKRIQEIKIPENTGLLLLNSDNSIIYSANVQCKHLNQQIKKFKIGEEFHSFSCGNYHYTVFGQEIFINKWKVFTYFINEKVLSSFLNVRKKLLKNFIFQIALVVLFTLVLFIAFFIFFEKFRRKLVSQFHYLIDFIKRVPSNYEKIDLNKLEFVEIEEIGKYSNEMVDTIEQLNFEIVKEKNFLKAILENMPYGIGVLTPDLKIEYANDYAIFSMGYDKSIIGRNFTELIPKDLSINKDEFMPLKLIEELKKTKQVIKIDKFKLFKKDGSFIYAYLALAPILNEHNKELERVVIIFYDITEELKLKREIDKLTKAVENVPVSIVITDTDFKIEYLNPFCQQTSGYSLEEIKGKKPKIFGTEYNIKLYRDILKIVTSGNTWEGEFLNKKKNGELYWEHVFISPIFNKKGKIVNFVAVKEDITERKKFIEELKKAKEKAEIANRAKSQFLANMSHEIRTPMNAIIGFINLLLETDLNEAQKNYLQLVSDSSKNLLRILNDILDLSKFESAKMEFENRAVDLKKVIRNCANIFSGKAAEKNLNFYIEIDEAIPEALVCDEVRISQVLNNLLNNAIKFTEKGSVKLEAKLLATNEEKASILFCIKDTGIGIPKDKLTSIFDTFSQVDGSITRRFGGTGLGLSIAKKIVEYYSGDIWVESEKGKGSEFYFKLELPVAKKEDLVSEDESLEKSWTHFENAKILVAEDNITNQILINAILKKFQIDVVIANNGKEALEILSENEFELIFMDWHMPIMDGVEALEVLRKAEKGEPLDNNKISKGIYDKLQNRKYIVIALTAAAMKSEKEELLKKGFDAYLSKPLEKDELLKILKKYLNIKEEISIPEIEPDDLDLTYLKNLVGNNDELLKKIIDSFKNTYKECLENIERFLLEKKYKSINITAHTLKGTAANIGFKNIAAICENLENVANLEKDEEIKLIVSELKEKFEKFFK